MEKWRSDDPNPSRLLKHSNSRRLRLEQRTSHNASHKKKKRTLHTKGIGCRLLNKHNINITSNQPKGSRATKQKLIVSNDERFQGFVLWHGQLLAVAMAPPEGSDPYLDLLAELNATKKALGEVFGSNLQAS